jgi:phosphoglycerate dehydrogenase-like enzyme
MSEDTRPLVLVTEGSDPRPLEWMRQQVRVAEVRYDAPDFEQHLARADGLAIRTYTKVTPTFLEKAPKLKVVGRGGVGLENIDVTACRRRGIEVVYTPNANTLAVGDFVFGGLLQLLRPWAPMRDRVYTPEEFKKIRAGLRGRQLNEMTIGILGMGRVGKRVGHIAANGFGMRVIYNDLLADVGPLDFPATAVDKPTLFREADVLSLHVDMHPGNEHLVGQEQIAQMKSGAILINTSRGEVLDERAVADALRAKHLGGAMIDVYWPEPPAEDFPLVGFDNALLTPHLAARTHTAIENMSWVVRDIVAVLEGRKPQYPAPVR